MLEGESTSAEDARYDAIGMNSNVSCTCVKGPRRCCRPGEERLAAARPLTSLRPLQDTFYPLDMNQHNTEVQAPSATSAPQTTLKPEVVATPNPNDQTPISISTSSFTPLQKARARVPTIRRKRPQWLVSLDNACLADPDLMKKAEEERLKRNAEEDEQRKKDKSLNQIQNK